MLVPPSVGGASRPETVCKVLEQKPGDPGTEAGGSDPQLSDVRDFLFADGADVGGEERGDCDGFAI